MCYRCVRGLLLVLGSVLLITAILPVFALVRLPEGWDSAVMASKLLMLPIGAICLLGAAMMQTRQH